MLTASSMSISPFSSAFTCVSASGIHIHSTRSRLTTFPPERPAIGSARGLYLANLVNTSFSPGFHSSFLNTNGPEPTYSSICLKGSVSAIRLGIMKGTTTDGLPMALMSWPNLSLSRIWNVFGSTIL